MWANTTERRRSINWKYVIILLLFAGAMLLGSLMLQQPQRFWRPQKAPSIQSGWVKAPCGANSTTIAIDDRLYFSREERIQVYDLEYSIMTEHATEGTVLCPGSIPVSYVQLGNKIRLWNGDKELYLPGKVDAVFTGEDHIAVITAASGTLTETLLFDAAGNEQGRILMAEEAMVFGGFLSGESLFAGLSFSEDRCWYLTFYEYTGAEVSRTAISADVCGGLAVVDDHVMVRTDRSLLVYDKNGGQINQISFGTEDFVSWDTRGNLFALITKSRETYYLKTIDESGAVLGEATLPGTPRQLRVSGKYVFVLEYEALWGYDALCSPILESREGMRGYGLAADDQHVWLLGNGELMEIKTS